jgi:hypothetical protein
MPFRQRKGEAIAVESLHAHRDGRREAPMLPDLAPLDMLRRDSLLPASLRGFQVLR